jgi:hypothetical protein
MEDDPIETKTPFPAWLEDKYFYKLGTQRPAELDQFKQALLDALDDNDKPINTKLSYNNKDLNSMAYPTRMMTEISQGKSQSAKEYLSQMRHLGNAIQSGGSLEGVAHAQMAWGFLFAFSAVSKKQFEAGWKYIELAANQGYASAQVTFADICQKERDKYLALASKQGFSIDKFKKHERVKQVNTVGVWLVRISFISICLLMAAAAANFYINPLFTTLMPFFAGFAAGAGLVGLLGAGIFVVSTALILPTFVFWAPVLMRLLKLKLEVSFLNKSSAEKEKEQKEETEETEEVEYPWILVLSSLVFSIVASNRLKTGLMVLGILGFITMLIMTFGSGGVLAPFFALTTNALLLGLTILAGLPGLGFLTTMFSPAVVHGLVMTCFILAPIFITETLRDIVGWFLTGRVLQITPPNEEIIHDNPNEDNPSEDNPESQNIYEPVLDDLKTKTNVDMPKGWWAVAISTVTENGTTHINEGEYVWVSPNGDDEWCVGKKENGQELSVPKQYLKLLPLRKTPGGQYVWMKEPLAEGLWDCRREFNKTVSGVCILPESKLESEITPPDTYKGFNSQNNADSDDDSKSETSEFSGTDDVSYSKNYSSSSSSG